MTSERTYRLNSSTVLNVIVFVAVLGNAHSNALERYVIAKRAGSSEGKSCPAMGGGMAILRA